MTNATTDDIWSTMAEITFIESAKVVRSQIDRQLTYDFY